MGNILKCWLIKLDYGDGRFQEMNTYYFKIHVNNNHWIDRFLWVEGKFSENFLDECREHENKLKIFLIENELFFLG